MTGSIILALIIWAVIICFDRQLLLFFGAQDHTLTLAREYVRPVKAAIPFFLFNRQIMIYLGTNALAVYGVIVNISTFVQCCSYSVGQASQPIISTNFGAGKGDRIRETLKYALGTAAFFSLFWTALACKEKA